MTMNFDSITIKGNKAGVLLLHTFGGSPAELRFMAHAFGRAGYTVHVPLLPGMADGTDISNLSSWTHWYEEAAKAHGAICRECDSVVVGGASMGALLALRLAALRPESVHGLMLYAPIFWPNGTAIPWYFQLFRLVRHKWSGRLFQFTLKPPYGLKDERIRRFVIDSLTSDGRSARDVFTRNGGVVIELRWLAREVRRRLGSIRQHTLLFHPRFDDQSDLSTAMTLQRKLGGLVETYVLDDCAHRVCLDRQRAFVEERSLDYVSRTTRQIEARAALARVKAGISAGAE